mgnify:CR=1 FL=1
MLLKFKTLRNDFRASFLNLNLSSDLLSVVSEKEHTSPIGKMSPSSSVFFYIDYFVLENLCMFSFFGRLGLAFSFKNPFAKLMDF